MAAIITAINAAGGHAYEADDVKKLATLPSYYTEVYVTARVDENGRVGGLGGITGARVVTRAVAKSQHNAETERTKVAVALLGSMFVVDGETFGPIRREVGDEPIGDEGDGWWSGTSSWIYA